MPDSRIFPLAVGVLCLLSGWTLIAAPPDTLHQVRPVATSNFPRRVHVFEDFETDIEKRWWLRGELETKDVPASATPNLRACRAAETLNFDRKMGDRTNKVKGVIFNPVPGPPMSGNTRLSFRYRIEGSDTIKVQIYSLSKGYHRYLVISDLPRGRWRTATVDMTKARRPDGSGGALSVDERIDDIQFYVSPAAELLIDDIVLFDAAAEGEHRPFPVRVIFTGWFDTGTQGQEWPGDFDIVAHHKPLTWDAARSVRNEATGQPWIRVALRGERRLGSITTVGFRYKLTGGKTIQVVLANSRSQVRFHETMTADVAGGWSESSVNFVIASNERVPLPRVDEVRFLIDPGATLEIDDVLIYEPGQSK